MTSRDQRNISNGKAIRKIHQKFENSGLLCWPPAARGQLKMIPKCKSDQKMTKFG